MRKRIALIGPYRNPDIELLAANMRAFYEAHERLIDLGFAPLCPTHDFIHLQRRPQKVTDLQETTLAWIAVADGVLTLPGYKTSRGCKAELELIKGRRIPSFRTIVALEDYYERPEGKV